MAGKDPKINFLSRTWQEIRDEGIKLIKKRFPKYTDTAASDFGVMITEVIAKFVRMLDYRINFLANEAFLVTATQRKSLLKYADQLGYTPKLPAAASVDLTFSKTDPSVSAIVPKGVSVTTAGDEIQFLTTEQLYLRSGKEQGEVPAINAERHEGELLGYSNGEDFQEFTLDHGPLVERSDQEVIGLDVYVDGSRWSVVDGIKTHLPSEQVCELSVDENEIAHLTFGDDRSGVIPPEDTKITVDYYVGGGTEGLVGPNTLINIEDSVDNVDQVTNGSEATGGRDRLTDEELRSSIMAQVQTLERVVTKSDYKRLIPAEIPEIKKVDVEHPRGNTVNVYVAPTGGNPPSADLLDQVQNFLDRHAIETDDPIAKAPDVIAVDVDVSVIAKEGHDPQDFMVELKDDLREYVNRWEFTDSVYINDIYAWLEERVAVKEGTVNKLARKGESGINNLSTEIGEVFTSGDISVSVKQE